MTPAFWPVNTSVAAPGDYGFTNFVRVGIPLVLVVSVVPVPWLPLLR